MYKSVLVLAPHTDDGELGAGGTIARFIREGADIDYVAFSSCEESVPTGFDKDVLRREVIAATAQLGILNENVRVLNYKVRNFPAVRQEILEDLIEIRRSKKYDLVLIPSTTDIHQDHKTISEEGLRAFKNYNLWGYELNWNQLTSDSTCFVRLELKDILAKIESIKMYESQYGRGYCNDDYLMSLAKVRGAQIGGIYAECFELIRCVF